MKRHRELAIRYMFMHATAVHHGHLQMTSGKGVREESFSTVSRDVREIQLNPHMCSVRSSELTMELESELCKKCQAFSVCDLDDSGYLMHTDVPILRRNAGTDEGQGGTSCGLCSLVWRSLQLDDEAQPLKQLPGEFHVRLYRNPPRDQARVSVGDA